MTAPRAAWRWIRRVLWAALFLLLVLLAWVLTIHFSDQKLEPQVAAILSGQGHEKIEPSENLFFTALGMGADGGEDLNAEGQRIFALYEQNRGKISDSMTLVDIYATAGVSKYKLVGDGMASSCLMWRDADAHHCIVDIPKQRSVWTPLVAANQRLVDRYRRLWNYSHYRNLSFLADMQPVNPLTDQAGVRRLYFTSLALQIDRGDLGGALHDIESDLAFWRHLLVLRDIGLVDKMVFNVQVFRDLEFISEILRTQSLSADQYDSLSAALAPNETAELTFSGVWENELRFGHAMVSKWTPKTLADVWRPKLYSQDLWDQLLSYLLYRPNAYANSAYRELRVKTDFTQLPCSQLKPAFDKLENNWTFSFEDFLSEPLSDGWGAIYLFEYDLDLPTRVCAMEGIQRIVRLQLAIRRSHTAESDIPSFISSAGPAYADPFTEQPMRWDSSTHTLYFDPRSERMSGILPWPI